MVEHQRQLYVGAVKAKYIRYKQRRFTKVGEPAFFSLFLEFG